MKYLPNDGLKADILLRALCAYSLTAPQTATAPRDAPWLSLTGTARSPGAKTQNTNKYTHPNRQRQRTRTHSQSETLTQA